MVTRWLHSLLNQEYIGSAIYAFFQLVLISWMVTLTSCLNWQKIRFILPPNEYSYLYAWTTLGSGPAIDLQKMSILAKKIVFSDEAHFNLGGYVNKQNCRVWGTDNPHTYIEKPSHPKRVTVCCGFCSRGIIRPFFFENEQGEAVTVNGDCYRAMLNEENIGNIWFQQDNTRCFAPCFWRSHYQPQSWCRLATLELRFDTVLLLFVIQLTL